MQGEAEAATETQDTIFEGLDGAGKGVWRELAVRNAPCPRYGLQLAWFAGQVCVVGLRLGLGLWLSSWVATTLPLHPHPHHSPLTM